MAIEFLFPPSLGKRLATVRGELLSLSLGPWVGQPVLVEVADSYEELENRLLARQADVVWAPPALCARALGAARAILKAVRSGRSQYRAALVCRADDAFGPDDLQGLRAAWVDRRSTGGFLLPRTALERLGHDPDALFTEQRFRGSYRAALRAVLRGDADVAPVFVHQPDASSLRHSLAEHLGADADRLVAVLYTGPSPTDGLVISNRVSEADTHALLRALVPESGGGAPAALLELFDAEAFAIATSGDFAALRSTEIDTDSFDAIVATARRLRREGRAAATEGPPLRAYTLVGLAVDRDGVCQDLWVRAPARQDGATDLERGRSLTELFGTHPGQELAELVSRAASTGERGRYEYCLDQPGAARWFSAELMGRAESGQDTWLLLVRETTERRRLKQNLVELASFPLLNPNPSLEITGAGSVTYLNPRARDLFPDLSRLGPEHPLLRTLTPRAELTASCAAGPVRRRATVNERCYDLTISKVPDTAGLRIDAVDVSAQDAMERALRASEQRYRNLFENNLAGVYQTDVDGVILKCNASFATLLGYPDAETLEGVPLSGLFVDQEAWIDRVARLVQRASVHNVEVALKRRDGATVWVLMSEHRTELEPDAPTVEGTVVDISERRQMESNMLQTAQMLSIGTLAAGVAHELNNPLTCVLGNLYVADQQLQQLAQQLGGTAPSLRATVREILEALGESREGADRARTIVRDMRAFSRVDEQTTELLDLHEVLEASIKMSRSELRHRARVLKDFSDLPLVSGNRARLSQVFLNLLINAAHACSTGRENIIRVATHAGLDGEAIVEVHDTGSGIPEHLRSRIFEPFFTTKPIGVGTGLGLSICHTIISHLGGEISVESDVGHGTTFRVVLPAARVPDDAGPAATPAALAVALPALRVLVVDDEPGAGRAIRRCLTPCKVELAANGSEALERIAQKPPFDVVVCDSLMPGMTGMTLHERVQHTDPDLARRFLFVTGAVFTPEVSAFLASVPNPRLQKPFEMDKLRALVSAVPRLVSKQ